MSDQYLAICEETTRGTKPETPTWKFVPVKSGMVPKFKPDQAPRKEIRGQDVGLGDASVQRKSSQFTHAPEFFLYPGGELGLMLKHLLGHAGTRATLDTSAKKGILYPLLMPYNSGALGTKAIGVCPNVDRDGTTKSQYWGGERFKSCTLTAPAGDDITISFEGQGAGPWVAAPNQTEVGGATFPSDSLIYHGSMARYYIGAGATRTGTAPDYTDIVPNTMVEFFPENFTLKIMNGLDDKIVGNGVRGPSRTERVSQFDFEASFTVDFTDPASGFSSIDEFEATFSAPRTNSLMVVITHTTLAGAATAYYQEVIDLPLVLIEAEEPDVDNEGKQRRIDFTAKRLMPAGDLKPLHWMRIDQAAAY